MTNMYADVTNIIEQECKTTVFREITTNYKALRKKN